MWISLGWFCVSNNIYYWCGETCVVVLYIIGGMHKYTFFNSN